MDDANLMLIFALSFAKRMGSYGTWAHTVPSQILINKIMTI